MATKTKRDEELSGRSKIRERLLDVFADVEKGFTDQTERSDAILDYWDLYNCILGGKQAYNGNSNVFVPIVHNAINARKTRFTNAVFPKAGRYVDVIDQEGEQPHTEMALAEHYIRRARLRTRVAPALNKSGDIEGSYNVYVDWESTSRHVVWRKTRPVRVGGVDVPEAGDVEEIEEDTILDAGPTVEVLSDMDVLILPVTVDSVDEALEVGGSVTVLRRWTRATLKKKIKDGDIVRDVGDRLMKAMKETSGGAGGQRKDPRKEAADAAGIKAKGAHTLVYETWVKLQVDGELRLCRAYYAGEERILGAKLNPYWCDRCPLISEPVDKVAGVAKGKSLVAACEQMQLAANDAANEGMDSAAYGLMPIIMTDPNKNPRVGSMILSLAAIWQTDPNSTKFAQFPQLWKDAFDIVATAKSSIYETLSVNPSMIPQQSGRPGSKRNQAEIANEQAVDILTTADAVGVQEEGIWTPIVQRFMELDAQYRSDEVTVRAFGQLGLKAKMTKIPPLQMGRRYEFRWFGVEQARNAAQLQQQIAAINVVRGVPPAMYPGRQIDLTVFIERVLENAFGPRDTPLLFRDMRSQLAIDPEEENRLLAEGFALPVHQLDNDVEHLQAHLAELQATGDPTQVIAAHMLMHQQAMQAKQAAMQQGGKPGGTTAPGTPGATGPGVAGVPRIGAQPGAQRPAQQPPGAIPPDQMPAAGAVPMPRRA